MKKILLKACMVLLVVLTPLSMQATGTITYTATYDRTLTTGTDTLGGVTYTTVHYGNLFNSGTPGMPSLPVDYIRFSVPWNATNFSVSAQLQDNVITNVNCPVYPCQPLRLISDTLPVAIALPDSSAYFTNTCYPEQNAWISDEGFIAGENHTVTVAVMPVSSLCSISGETDGNLLRKSGIIRLTLSYDLCESPAIYPIIRRNATLRKEGYALARGMVVNPSNVEANAPTEMASDQLSLAIPDSGDRHNQGYVPPSIDSGSKLPNPTLSNRSQSNDYPYVIVTTDTFSHSLRRLAALKKQKGYGVQVLTMGNVLNNLLSGQGDVVNNVLTFTDEAGKLRQFLRNYYAIFGTEFVLLAGNGVPYRHSTWQNNPPCDMYFSDFNTDYRYQMYDNGPEIYVGRILAKTEEQINNYTDKLYRYELNPGHGDPSYLKRALYTESVDMLGNSNSIRQAFGNVFSVDSVIKESAWNRSPKGADIINEINETKYGFLSFHEHGGPSAISVYGVNGYMNPREYDNHIKWIWALDHVHIYNSYYKNCDTVGNALDLINNKWMPNILYTIACETMPFDTIPGFEDIPMNFGESFTTGKDYGGPAYLGNTRNGYLNSSDGLERVFAQQVVGGYYKIGQAEALSKANYSLNQINTIHNLLGDPEFEMWTDIPQQYSGITITRTDNSISISGIGASLSTVAFYENGGRATKMTANSSSVTVNADPNSTIMLYKHNYIPYIAPLVLQNVSLSHSQYVIASDLTAGSSVDIGRTGGDVIVPSGVEYEIEASGTVSLQGGFEVELGGVFAVYPACF